MKRERVNRVRYRTRKQARADIFQYIECFYNRQRRHSYIGYISPVNYEQQSMGHSWWSVISGQDHHHRRYQKWTDYELIIRTVLFTPDTNSLNCVTRCWPGSRFALNHIATLNKSITWSYQFSVKPWDGSRVISSIAHFGTCPVSVIPSSAWFRGFFYSPRAPCSF